MKTILYGRVTEEHLASASLFAGIEPTEFITNGRIKPPAGRDLPTTVIPPEPLVPGEPGELQNDWRLVLHADALVLVGENEHLLDCARKYDLPIYQED
ncbi:hypothetical protein [Comamonas antarctica]|uniref:hypothetical protein n=1 Tax=Comamonas antarctica TaxID=2743470 RepID=UPI0028EE00AD|nr:hypothetical protein [Comamonas antarctica]